MTMNFGQLSFARESRPSVGLPLEIIDKVGTGLTKKYYENRSAVSNIKKEMMNLPDVGNEFNRKLIEDKTTTIKEKFSKFAKNDTWHEADDVVYQAADELMADPDVKYLMTDASNAAKIDKDIEDSKAPEMYKNLQRAKNKAMYKGIRDEKGNRLGYNGQATGDLDIQGAYKRYDDLLKGFEADVKSMELNPSNRNISETSDGFKSVAMKYGIDKVTKVSKQEVQNYLMGMVENDPRFKADITKMAELDLYGSTGLDKADKTVAARSLDSQATENPDFLRSIMYSSKSFIDATKDMKEKDRDLFAAKIFSNPALKDKYYQEGKEGILSNVELSFKNPDDGFDQLYKGMYYSKAMKGLSGMVDKYAYQRHDLDVKYMLDPMNVKNYERFVENLGTHNLISKGGQLNTSNAADYITLRGNLLSEISSLQGQLAATNLTPARKEELKNKLSHLESNKATHDLILDNVKSQLNMNDSSILDMSSTDNKNTIKDATTNINYLYEHAYNKNRLSLLKPRSEEQINKIDAVIKGNMGKSNNDIQQILTDANIVIAPAQIDVIKNAYTRTLKNNTQRLLETRGIDAVSIPINTIGDIGKKSALYERAVNSLAEKFKLGSGDFDILTVPSTADDDDQKRRGLTNIGRQKTYEDNEENRRAKRIGALPVRFELATIQTDSPYETGQPTFQVSELQKDGSTNVYLVRYKGNDELANQMLQEVLTNSTSSYQKENNPTKATDFESSRFAASVLGGNIPIKAIGDNKYDNNMTLAGAARYITPVNGNEYAPIKFEIQGIPYTITTIKNGNDKFEQHLLNANGQDILPPVTNGNTTNAMIQYAGALKSIYEVGIGSKASLDIQKTFNIHATNW